MTRATPFKARHGDVWPSLTPAGTAVLMGDRFDDLLAGCSRFLAHSPAMDGDSDGRAVRRLRWRIKVLRDTIARPAS